MKKSIAYVLYPWIDDPTVKLIWLSRTIYALAICFAIFSSRQCLLFSQIVGIQIFYSAMSVSGDPAYPLKSKFLRVLTNIIMGVTLSALITLSLFCFEGLSMLVAFFISGTVQHSYVFYLSPLIFIVLATNWWLATKTPNI